MRLLGLIPYPVMALVTLVVGPAVILLSVLGLRRAAHRPVELWCLPLHLVTGVRFRVEGLEHVPRGGPCVLISNDSSHLDGPTLIRQRPERHGARAQPPAPDRSCPRASSRFASPHR